MRRQRVFGVCLRVCFCIFTVLDARANAKASASTTWRATTRTSAPRISARRRSVEAASRRLAFGADAASAQMVCTHTAKVDVGCVRTMAPSPMPSPMPVVCTSNREYRYDLLAQTSRRRCRRALAVFSAVSLGSANDDVPEKLSICGFEVAIASSGNAMLARTLPKPGGRAKTFGVKRTGDISAYLYQSTSITFTFIDKVDKVPIKGSVLSIELSAVSTNSLVVVAPGFVVHACACACVLSDGPLFSFFFFFLLSALPDVDALTMLLTKYNTTKADRYVGECVE